MPKYNVPVTTTRVFQLPTTTGYDIVMSWLNAATADALLGHGIQLVSGRRSTRTITITAPSAVTDIDTDAPIKPIAELIGG